MGALKAWVPRAARLAFAAGWVWCAPAGVQAQGPGSLSLEILGPDSMTSATKDSAARQTVFVRNPSAAAVPLRVALAVQGDSGGIVTLTPRGARLEVPAASVSALELVFDVPEPLTKQTLSGYLVVADARGSLLPATRWTSVSPPRPDAAKRKPLFGNVLLHPLVLAVASVVTAAVLVRRRIRGWMTGTPTWDFAKSWASTTTIATAFANGALVALIPKATQEGLAALAAVFAVLVLIAPSAYNLSLRRAEGGGAEPGYKGLVGFYLLASTLTLWGVLGALYCGYLLLNQISWEPLTEDRAIRLFEVLPVVIGGLVAAYGVATIRRTVEEQAEGPDPAPATAGSRSRPGTGTATIENDFKLERAPAPEHHAAPRSARPAFPLL